MNLHLIVVAKAPVAGRVKTRLCPPCTPDQAAAVAAAALAATLATAASIPTTRRTMLLDGRYPAGERWRRCGQRGRGLGARLAHGLVDTAVPDTDTLLVGMDTPQVRPAQLLAVAAALTGADAVLGPAEDGGWWALALRDARHGVALAAVPMSTADTGRLTAVALRARGLRVAYGPTLRDVDTAADAHHVAGLCPGGPFPAAVAAHVPPAVAAPRSAPDPAAELAAGPPTPEAVPCGPR